MMEEIKQKKILRDQTQEELKKANEEAALEFEHTIRAENISIKSVSTLMQNKKQTRAQSSKQTKSVSRQTKSVSTIKKTPV